MWDMAVSIQCRNLFLSLLWCTIRAGEMVMGPSKTLFLDEISTGLDSATTFQIMESIGRFARVLEVRLFAQNRLGRLTVLE
jgi:hypothetical protein